MITPLTLILIASLQVKKLPVVDVKFDLHTVAVADPNTKQITLTPGGEDVWICAPYEFGRSCRTARDIAKWILQSPPSSELPGSHP